MVAINIMKKEIRLFNIFCGLLIVLALSECRTDSGEQADGTILNVDFTGEVSEASLSELFPNHKLIKLETNENSLVGTRDMKVIMRDSIFYIRAINDIVEFGPDGSYIGKLSRVGAGPEEYESLGDFDIVKNKNGEVEIWVSRMYNIHRYTADTGEFLGKINSPDPINQIYFVNDSSILLATAGDLRFKVIDMEGNVRHEFLEKDFANTLNKPVQFRRKGNIVFNQIDNTNEAVAYDVVKDSFEVKPILADNESFLTPEANRTAYEKYGMKGQYKHISENYIQLVSVVTIGDKAILNFSLPSGDKISSFVDGDNLSSYRLSDTSSLINDIIPEADIFFVRSIVATDADNDFIFIVETDEDENPYLLLVSE